MRGVIAILFFLVVSLTYAAGQTLVVRRDLKPEWLVFDGKTYDSARDRSINSNSIHFKVNASRYPKHFIRISSGKRYYVFINGKLVEGSDGPLIMSLDSLREQWSETAFLFSVYQRKLDPRDVRTELVMQQNIGAKQPQAIEPKPPSAFRDFVVTAGLLLSVLFIVMIRVQPKLAADYFSLRRIVSLREGEDNQAHARFAISSNLWFYIFASLLTAFFLLILFHHLSADYLVTVGFGKRSFPGIFGEWFRLSLLVFVLLLVKVLLIFVLSNLFGLRGIAGVHFFNAVRLLLVVTSGLSVILFVYFISRGYNDSVYAIFLHLLVATLIIWVGLVFFKLSNRVDHSMFHLFSYICATELIPLLLTVKVLFQ
ncbi:MAG TPA: DUF4271 domain-containing protein [Chryseosolibacter sp.]|nr:DUF4271 domain-containing protein [Chryseosolibacter sp.]